MRISSFALTRCDRLGLSVLCALLCGPVGALDLVLPSSAALNLEVVRQADSVFVASGPYENGRITSLEVEGSEVTQAWQFSAPGLTSLQIMSPLRDQVTNAGFEILLDCAAPECGGFDFRYEIDVLPAPDMYVDLFEYRFLSARSTSDGPKPRYLEILTSRVGALGYVQISQVTQTGASAPSLIVKGVIAESNAPTARDLPTRLQSDGRLVLSDLEFVSGSVDLGAGPFETLGVLAAFLKADENRRVALVGHTDSVGGFEANLSLSRRRAEAVLNRLVSDYGVAEDQVEAEGAAYLAPLATNLTPDGRETNRRVEAVLLNTE